MAYLACVHINWCRCCGRVFITNIYIQIFDRISGSEKIISVNYRKKIEYGLSLSYWLIASIGILILLFAYVAYLNYEKSSRRRAVLNAVVPPDTNILHIIIESEIGNVSQCATTVGQLLDSANVPTRVCVHVLEPVTSIKAYDDMTPSIRRASELGPRYGHYFREQILLTKVHQSRNLVGPQALLHVLDKTLSIKEHDWVVHWPARLRPVKGWDDAVREEGLLTDMTFLMFASVRGGGSTSTPSGASASEAESFFESWFGSDKAQAKAAFFALDPNLGFRLLPMSRAGITKSIGISFNWPIASQAHLMKTLCQRCAQFGVRDEELALSFLAQGTDIWVSGKLLCLGSVQRRVPNRRHQLSALWHVLEAQTPQTDTDNFLYSMALEKTNDDIIVFSRSLLGISAGAGLQEILIKYGSEAAFETEKEALKYG